MCVCACACACARARVRVRVCACVRVRVRACVSACDHADDTISCFCRFCYLALITSRPLRVSYPGEGDMFSNTIFFDMSAQHRNHSRTRHVHET